MWILNRSSILQDWSDQPLVCRVLNILGGGGGGGGGRHDDRLRLKNPRVLFAFVQTLLT